MRKLVDPMSRRNFLSSMTALTLSGVSVMSDSGPAYAQTTDDDYKALVCVYFGGGMDHNDMIFPYEEQEYGEMRTVREQIFEGYSSKQFNRDRNSLIPIESISTEATLGRVFALPEELRPLSEMFDAEDLCFIGNVGALIEPVTRSTFEARGVKLPPALFSHNDQTNYFQGLAIEGARAGWGGKFIDALTASGQVGTLPQYASVSTDGRPLFLAGIDTPVFQVGADTVQGPTIERNTAVLGEEAHMNLVRSRLANYFRNTNLSGLRTLNHDMHGSQTSVMTGIDGFGGAYNNLSALATSFPDTPFATELKTVAQAMRASRDLGLKRQVYFVSYGGFDSHRNQFNQLPAKQSTLSNGVQSFSNAMKELGMWNDVTLFSGGDFGRGLISNGGGTDHGWGTHHFVAGGAIKGKNIFGSMPGYYTEGEEYTARGAKLIPSTSIEQYGATMGKWLGVNDNDILNIFPNLANFSTSTLDIYKS